MAADKSLKLAFILSATDKMSRVVDQAVGKATNKLSSFQRKTSNAGKSMMKAGGIMVGAGAAITAGAFQMAKSTADYAGEVYDMARATGLGVEEYQKMAYAAKMSGIENEKLSSSFVRLNKLVVDASNGSKSAAQTFKDLGINLKDAQGNFRAPNEIFEDIADIFEKVEDGAAKTALAYELFGKSGADLIPMLNDGKIGLNELYKAAERSGNVLTKETILAADKFGDKLEEIKLQTKGATLQLGVALLPTIQGLTEKFSKVLTKVTTWIKENPKLVKTIAKIVTIVGVLITALGGIAIVVGIINTVFMSGPIGWIILIIMAIATAAFLIIKNWDKIKAFFKKLWDAVVGIFKSAWEWIKGIWSGITGFFSNLWNGIKGTAGKIWGGIKNVISKAKDGVQKAWAGTKGFFGRLWGGIKEGASKGWNGIKNLFLNYTPHGLIIKHWDKIADWFTNIWSRVKEATVNAWNSIGEFFSGLGTRFFEWGKNLINSLWEGIKSMVNKVVEGVKNVAKKIAGGFKSFFGINSPSKLFTEYGVNITQGLTIGLDHGGANVEAATQGMAMQVTRGADSAMSANTIPASQLANNYSGGTSVQYSPNITIQGNMGPQEQQDFLRLLRQHGDEIVEIINRDRQNRDRLSFAY